MRTCLCSKALGGGKGRKKIDSREPIVVSLKLKYHKLWGVGSEADSLGWRPLSQMGMGAECIP